MEKNETRFLIPDLPDEAEYPAELTEQWELFERFSEKEGVRTLLAVNRESGEKAVVKCWPRESALYGAGEPEALRRLSAPPIPRFLAEYRNEQMRCVLREYVPGDTLAVLAGNRTFSEREVLNIGLQLCEQLSVLHGMTPPVIHRDIKPQNVVIRPDGQAVLIDFGIARVQTEKETDTVIFGTQGFAPPEQYGFARTDARSDIYSLGILLWWLLHRETRVSREGKTPLEKVIARCTHFDPAHRFSDVLQVRRALYAAKPEARKRKKRALALTAILAALLIAAGVRSAVKNHWNSVRFSQPLIEQAVRLNLGLEDGAALTKGMLGQVSGVYIVADAAFADADEFYPAVSRWYAEGQPVRGSVTDLSDLSQLTGLEQVCVVAQELSDISALGELKKLNKVELKHNYITDISPLAGMNRLTSVGINDNPVRDLSPLLHCPNLAFLDLCDVRSYDPSVIAELGNFDFLDISNPTESYRYLDGKSILDLRIAWTGLDDLRVLDGVTRLERLEIDHTSVSDLSPLSRHTGLKVLRLSGLPVKDLGVLRSLPQLEEVFVSAQLRPAVEALGEVPFTVRYE